MRKFALHFKNASLAQLTTSGNKKITSMLESPSGNCGDKAGYSSNDADEEGFHSVLDTLQSSQLSEQPVV
jgi:hypothetical protein